MSFPLIAGKICIIKKVGEILGIAVVESGWGSILPTVVVANLLHGGVAERSGDLSIGDRIMSVNGASLVGLPITTCHNIIRVSSNTAVYFLFLFNSSKMAAIDSLLVILLLAQV